MRRAWLVLGIGVVSLMGACSSEGASGGALLGGDNQLGGGSVDDGGAGATTAGGGGTAGSVGGTTSNTGSPNIVGSGDGGSCETVVLKADRAVPDMLIVLDKSGSMSNNRGADNVDRWSGSTEAINTVVAELEQEVQFGLMTFPGAARTPPECEGLDVSGCQVCAASGYPDQTCFFGLCFPPTDCATFDQTVCDACAGALDLFGDSCGPGGLDVPIALNNADPISSTLGGLFANGATPTSQTLAAARDVLAQQPREMVGGPEGFLLPQYVMLVTDGDPNCHDGTGDDEDTVAQQATIEEVEALTAAGARTYVIGYQTAGTDFADVLDRAAAAGGTGDTAHRSVASGTELLEEFRSIAGGAASCSFVLAREVKKSHVEIRVDGELTSWEDGDWELREDGRTIDLLGATCEALRGGAKVEAEVFCKAVRVI